MKNKKEQKNTPKENTFYFGKKNFRLMLGGLLITAVGFVLMMGYGANTRPDGSFDANYWNEDIFSMMRIRVAPFLVITGFVVQIFAILKRKK